jgi:hypothetical protein
VTLPYRLCGCRLGDEGMDTPRCLCEFVDMLFVRLSFMRHLGASTCLAACAAFVDIDMLCCLCGVWKLAADAVL